MGRARGRTYELKARFSVEADVSNLEALEKRLAKLENRINKFGGVKKTARVGVKGAKEATEQVDTLDQRMEKLDKMTAEAEATINQRKYNKMMGQLDFMGRKLDTMFTRPYEFEIGANAKQAEGVLRKLATQANDMARRAYELEINAETHGFEDAEERAQALYRESLRLSGMRARLAVEVAGIPKALAGLTTIKQAANGVEGEYEVTIDVNRLKAAATAGNALGAAVGGLRSHLMNAGPLMATVARSTYILQQAMYVASIAILGVAVAAAVPLVAGLTIAASSLAAAAAGFGLLAVAAIPIVNAFSDSSEAAEKAKSAHNSLQSANEGLRSSYDALRDANQNITTTAQSNAESIRSAVESHKEAIRGVAEARRTYQEALRGVHEAEVAGEQQVRDAINQHREAVQAVAEARRTYKEALRGVHEAEIAGEQQVRDAVLAHKESIQAVADARRDVGEAQRGVLEAEREGEQGVRDAIEAHRASLQGIRDAQYDYRMAQQDTAASVRDLRMATMEYNDALATEQMRLQSMRLDMAGMVLSQKQLALEIEAAQKAIAEAETPEEREAAELRYQQLLLQRKQGMLDIENAQREMNEAEKRGTEELRSAAEARKNASRDVVAAKRSERQAAKGVTEAEKESAEAYREIARARREGQRGVVEANRSLAASQRALASAVRAEGQAQREIGRARKEAARGVREAQRQVTEAQRGINEALRSEAQAQKEIGRARREATRGVRDAQRAVSEAQRGIREALRNERQAERGIAKARQDAARAMQDALRQQAQAQRDVAKAQREVAKAQKELNKVTRDKKLPKYLEDLKKEAKSTWKEFKSGTRQTRRGMAQLATGILKSIRGAMPQITRTTNRTFGGVRRAFEQTMKAWKRNNVFQSIRQIMRQMPSITRNWSKALGNVIGVFINLWRQSMPYARRFSESVKRITREWLNWSQSNRGRRMIQKFFESAAPVAKTLWKWIARIGGSLIKWSISHPKQVAAAIDMVGTVIWGVLRAVGAVVHTLTRLHVATNGVSSVMLGSFLGIYGVFRMIPKPIRQIIAALWKYLRPIAQAKLATLGVRGVLMGLGRFILTKVPLWGLAFSAAWNFLKNGVTYVKELFNTFRGYGKTLGPIGKNWGKYLMYGFRQLVASGMKWMLQTVHDVIKDIEGVIRDTLNWIPGINLGDKLLPDDKKDAFQTGIDKLYDWTRGKTNQVSEAIGKNMGEAAKKGGQASNKLANDANKDTDRMRRAGAQDSKGWAGAIDRNTRAGKEAGTKHSWDMARSMNKANSTNKEDTRKRFMELKETIANSTGNARKEAMKEMVELKNGMHKAHTDTRDNARKRFTETNTAIDFQTKDAKEKGIKHSWDLNRGADNAHTSMRDIVKDRTNAGKTWVDENGKIATTAGIRHAWDLKRGGENAMTAHRDAAGRLTGEAGVRMANNTKTGTDKSVEHMHEMKAGTITVAEQLGIAWDAIKDIGGKLMSSSGKDATELSMSNMSWATGGVYRDGEKRYAAGGKQGPNGGVSNGTTRVYGEVPGTTEFYITDNPQYRSRNMDLLNMANQHMGHKVEEEQNMRGKLPSVPMWQGGKYAPKERGGELRAAYGATMWENLWDDRTAEIARQTEKATGARPNTYSNHPQGYEERAPYSIDWWGGGGRGDAIGTDLGNKVLSYIKSNFASEMSYWLWNGQASSSVLGAAINADPHLDHVHATFMQGLKMMGSNVTGTSGSGPDVQGLIDQHIPQTPNFNDGITGQIFTRASDKVREAAVDKIMSLAPQSSSSGGVTGNFTGDQKEVALTFAKNAVSRGIPGRLPVMTALQESGMRNLDYGDADSLGYFQQRPSVGAWGTAEQIRDPAHALDAFLDQAEHFKGQYENTPTGLGAWAQAVQISAYPDAYAKHWDAAASLIGDPKYYRKGGVYSNGGIATTPQMGVIGDRGNEIMMPLDDPRAMRMITKAFDNSKAVSANSSQTINQTQTGPGPQRSYISQNQNNQTNSMRTADSAHCKNMVENAIDASGLGTKASVYAGNGIARAGGVSADAAEIVRAVKSMTRDVVEATREDKKLHRDTIQDMVGVVLHGSDKLLNSRRGKDIMDDAIGERLDFDRILRGL